MLVRNVGHHMYTDAVLDADGARNPGGVPRRGGHLADRAARPEQHRAAAQQPRRLGLHRQAEDARAGRGGVHRHDCSPASRICWACRANTLKMGIMDEERRTSANLKACIAAAKRARGVHQHRLPRSHRRRDPHLDRSRPDDPQERHAATRRGSRPTRTRTSISAWRAGCAARRRSARACGRRPTAWPTCWRRRSAIRWPARTPPGCPRPPPRRCTRCTTMRSMSPRGRPSWRRARGRRWRIC